MLTRVEGKESATIKRRQSVMREILSEVALPLIGLISVLGIILFWPFQP